MLPTVKILKQASKLTRLAQAAYVSPRAPTLACENRPMSPCGASRHRDAETLRSPPSQFCLFLLIPILFRRSYTCLVLPPEGRRA